MRKSPAYALQQAVYDALTSAGLTRIYHTVPAGASLPWIVIGDDQIIADYDSADVSECHATVHVFADTMPNTKLIAATVCDALDQPINIEGFLTAEAQLESAHYIGENGGRNAHAVIEFVYRVQAI